MSWKWSCRCTRTRHIPSHRLFFSTHGQQIRETSIFNGNSLCTLQTHVEEKKMLEQPPEPEATKSFMHRGSNAHFPAMINTSQITLWVIIPVVGVGNKQIKQARFAWVWLMTGPSFGRDWRCMRFSTPRSKETQTMPLDRWRGGDSLEISSQAGAGFGLLYNKTGAGEREDRKGWGVKRLKWPAGSCSRYGWRCWVVSKMQAW